VPLADEETFDAASVMGAFHGWCFGVIAKTVDWMEANGIPPETSRALVAGMMRGAASVALEGDAPLEETLERLTTPGGITEAGFRTMAETRGLEAWAAACTAALDHMR
jgi:pyrroline-5-carboxylate reductase